MIIAHRGASDIAPENTRSAIVLAWEMKAAAVECDIRMTRDNQVVVIHDPNTLRTSGVDISIEDANYSELSQLDVGSFKDSKYAGEKIPLLADIIQTIPAGKNKKLFIEVKCGTEVLPYLKRIIEDSGKRERIVLISFKIEIVAQAKKILPDIPAYWLVMTDKDEKADQWIPHSLKLIDKTKGYGLDGLSLHWAGLNRDFVRQTHKASLDIYAWTVDDPDVARKLKKMGVDGITSNKPDLLKKKL